MTATLAYLPGLDGSAELLFMQEERLAERFSLVRVPWRDEVEIEHTDLVDDVERALDRAGVDRATVVAESFGGTVGLMFALARLARECGIDGVVASPLEIGLIRAEVAREDFVILTPGIRPAGGDLADQRRVTTPADAIAAGADFIVVGRPITGAPVPRDAAEAIVREIEAGTNATV